MALNLNISKYRQNFFSGITFFILTFLIYPVALGVLPPEVYEEAALSSAIKAIAVVEKVEVLGETDRSSFKKVFFKLKKSFTRGLFQKKVPQKFSGSCYSVDHQWQNPGVGGTIHYYPRKGALVLVTVGSDGGGITSYTTLSPAFEDELNKNGLKNINFSMGQAYIKKSAMSPEMKKEKLLAALPSIFSIGLTYFKNKNYQAASNYFKTAAQHGHADAQNYLGDLYFNGLGVEQNFQKALEWYEKSAKQNNARGAYNLGVLYINGKGVTKSNKRAFTLFLKSADLGYAKAQFNLGAMYYDGRGVDKDESTALKWFKKAAENNIPEAKKILKDLKQKKPETTTEKLFNALYENNIPLAKKLLAGEVDVNSRNETGQTLLHAALNEEIIKLLISKGADVNARNNQGMTPIFTKEVELTKILVNAGADISLQSSKGNTALMWYAYSGYLDGIKYLVSQGADIGVKNKDNQTAFDIAERFGHLKLLKYLEYVRNKTWLKNQEQLINDRNEKIFKKK